MKPYDDCIHCGGSVKEKKERLDYRYHGQLFIVENVLVGVCLQCGEKYLKATVAKKLEKLVSTKKTVWKSVVVPVVSAI